MRNEFNTEELRNTSEEIKTAVMAKSITPEMVGGTLLALVDAQGEVIEALGNLEREHVTVKVNAYDGSKRVDVSGAKVYVDMFTTGMPTVSVPRQELDVDENGEVSFDVLYGYQYTVFSKLEGLAASFQYTFQACQSERVINTWNVPIGVFMLGAVAYYNEETEEYRGLIPVITENYESDIWGDMPEVLEWDMRDGECIDDSYYGDFILVATAETSFAIHQDDISENYLPWTGNRFYGKTIPTLPAYDGDINWEEMQEAARADYDGNLNTAKILSFCGSEAQAASFCANLQIDWFVFSWLPSAGQLYLMYLNRATIDALITDANNDGHTFKSVSKDYDWHWSSTQYDAWCAWYVHVYDGYASDYDRDNTYRVRAVSAFHFEY